ncbi:MAG: GNAT family N-acetyltransferase [Ruminococcaceae bacterium]|nr:GNAT family N-acetyltransferase [Oscillospiraceae bacterium]
MLRIKLAENKDIPFVSSFCGSSLLGTKILCLLNAYGTERDFFSVWYCTDENEIQAVISKFDGSVTVLCNEEKCLGDIKAFLDMIGYTSLCCSERVAPVLASQGFTAKKAYIYRGKHCGECVSDLGEELYRDCYSLICENIPDSFESDEEAYLSFLSDFTFRRRRGLARLKGYTENGRLYSCALTSAETDRAAIISGVACDSSFRRKGLGKVTVLSVAEELKREGKAAYVIALNESAEGFYEHIGFQLTEKISFIERK